MLQHANFYMEGGLRTFAAVGTEVCLADKAAVGPIIKSARFVLPTPDKVGILSN